MGYLDNSSITVDAVLTKKGREMLKNGEDIAITQFTLSDRGVDYTLFNPNASQTSQFGEAIENLPQLEANVHTEFNLTNRLISLNQESKAIPTLAVTGMDTSGGSVFTFTSTPPVNTIVNVDLSGYNSSQNLGKILIIQDPSIIGTNLGNGVPVSGTSKMFLPEQDIPHAMEYTFDNSFTLIPEQQSTAGKQTNIFIYDVETGAQFSATCINNVVETITPQNQNPVG
jgi:hypothetical protein